MPNTTPLNLLEGKYRMKSTYMVLLMIVSGCVEFDCYSSLSYAKEQANNFCMTGKSDKELCESLKFEGKEKVCGISKNDNNACMATGFGIETFIRIPQYECKGLNEKMCKSKKSCDWNFKDYVGAKFFDFPKTSRSSEEPKLGFQPDWP
jgi:hypothetical protein